MSGFPWPKILSLKSNTTEAESILLEFRAGVVRSMKQYRAGQVKIFDDIDDFLNDLHSLG